MVDNCFYKKMGELFPMSLWTTVPGYANISLFSQLDQLPVKRVRKVNAVLETRPAEERRIVHYITPLSLRARRW